MTRCLWGVFVVVAASALAVHWLYIDDLRRRVSALEQICQSTYTDTHLPTMSNNDQSSQSRDQQVSYNFLKYDGL